MDANTVGAVAALTGVSVRTLHHYDHIGLVVPSVRTPAGYRGYTDADIERLHLVLVYRSVGMPLEEIRALLDDSSADVLEHLRRQHMLLQEQAERLQHTIEAVEELMNAHRKGIQLTAEEQVEIFGTEALRRSDRSMRPRPKSAGARRTRGSSHSNGFRSSASRTGSRSRPRVTRCLLTWHRPSANGVEPGSAEANELAARHRASIERFYDCGDEMQRNLVEMYLADERFTRYYDDVEPGLAQFVHDIVVESLSN